jgi:hypothetical protein
MCTKWAALRRPPRDDASAPTPLIACPAGRARRPADIDPGFPARAGERAGLRWSVTPAARAVTTLYQARPHTFAVILRRRTIPGSNFRTRACASIRGHGIGHRGLHFSGFLDEGGPSILGIRSAHARPWRQQSSPEKRAGTLDREIRLLLKSRPVSIARSGRPCRHLSVGRPASPAVGATVFSVARPVSFPGPDQPDRTSV